MKNWLLLLCLCLSWASKKSFLQEIEAFYDSSKAKGKLGIAVYSTRHQKFLLEKAIDSSFRPASTLKLIVTAAALDTFPLDWKPKTNLVLNGTLSGSKFNGQILLQGGGDPNVSGRFFGDAFSAFDTWGENLYQAGIDTLEGSLDIDINYFDGPQKPTTWKKEFFDKWYGAEISALSFNDNCIQVRIFPGIIEGDSARVEVAPNVPFLEIINKLKTVKGGRRRIRYGLEENKNQLLLTGSIGVNAYARYLTVPIRKPQNYFKTAFLEVLKQNGITFIDTAISLNLPPYANFSLETAPFISILDEINQRSQNLHAEILLRHLGEKYFKKGSLQNGLLAEKVFLHKIGADSSKVHLVDGSGLSYANRITPRTMIQTLEHMYKGDKAKYYRESMAIPGVSSRLKNLPFPQSSWFKTGFVNFTQGLTGYIATSTGDTLCVALYLNEYEFSDWKAKHFMDELWSRIVVHFDAERSLRAKARFDWLALNPQYFPSPNPPKILKTDTLSSDNAISKPQLSSSIQSSSSSTLPKLNMPILSIDATVPQSLFQKMRDASDLVMGRPYLGGATGEGVDGLYSQQPRINPDSFDCVTFIEYMMALVYSDSPNDIFNELQSIRYLKGDRNFKTRKHFFIEDWLLHGKDWVQLRRFPEDTTATRLSDKKKFFGFQKLPYKASNPQTELSYLTMENAIKFFEKPWTGKVEVFGIGFVGKLDWLWVTHTGIVFVEPGKRPRIRHASQKEKKVVDMDLADYLKTRQKSIVGTMFFDFKPLVTNLSIGK